MSDVEWKYLDVDSRAGDPLGRHSLPVGDASRWGGRAESRVTIPAGTDTPTVVTSSQILRVQTEDVYPRRWSLVGSLFIPEAFFGLSGTGDVILEMTMGGGFEGLVMQRVSLLTLASQATTAHGYLPTLTANGVDTPIWFGDTVIIGQAIAYRVIYEFGNSPPPSTTRDGVFVVTLITSPQAIST